MLERENGGVRCYLEHWINLIFAVSYDIWIFKSEL